MNKVVRLYSKLLCIAMIFWLALLCKIFQYTMLPSKYFIDSQKILLMISDDSIVRSLSYTVTAQFFKSINIFGFSTLLEWSIFLAIIFNIVFFIMLIRYKYFTIYELLFIYASMALLNIFSFNLNKEIIQLLIFNCIYLVILNKKIKINLKVIIINIILLLETLFFREYYIICFLSFNIITYLFIYTKNRRLKNLKPISKVLLAIMILLFLLGVSSLILPNAYIKLLEIRTISEKNLAEANTVIVNFFDNNGSYVNYVLNYILNFFRILIPFELLGKGLGYIPFVIYQLCVSWYIIKAIWNYNAKDILTLAIIVAYFMTSITFEPDYGSVVRHESTLFILILLLKKGTPL